MKKLLFVYIACLVGFALHAQDFAKHLTTARSSYSSGKLEDSRFAMQQMLQELDMITGKEILKLLPPKLQDLQAVTSKDEVTGTSGWMGVIIHREYGTDTKNINLEIISNSPIISSINAILSLPLIGASGDYKTIKVNGYRGLVQKTSGEGDKTEYEVQLPLHATLITIKAPGYTQDQLISIANALPIAQIADMVK